MARWSTMDEMLGLQQRAGVVLRRVGLWYVPNNPFDESVMHDLGWEYDTVQAEELRRFSEMVLRSGRVLEINLRPIPPGVVRGFKI